MKHIKLCKDCKHSINRFGMISFMLCKLSIKDINICDGEVEYHSCAYNRFDSPILARITGSCGKRGRFFEPKTGQET